MRRGGSVAIAAIGVALCASLSGCVGNADNPPPSVPTRLAEPTASPSHASSISLGSVSYSGTGSETVAAKVPAGAQFLNSKWKCSAGNGSVVLEEATGVFQKGTCGSDSGYQMPLPKGVAEVHFVITVDPDATWSFGGAFS